MPNSILFLLLFSVFVNATAEVVITPSEVYSQALLIEQETELVKRHFHISESAIPVKAVVTDLKPRHVWQKFYMLQMKIVAFRRTHNMDSLTPVVIEPSKRVDPRYTWAQTQRTLSEIRIVKKLLGINSVVGAAPQVENKTPLDVYNKLNQIETEWDLLAGVTTDPSMGFAQIMRLNEDVSAILRKLNVFDTAVPPAKIPESTTVNTLAGTFLVLEQIQRLQKLARIDTVDLSDFKNTENVKPAEIFNMVCFLIAEMQLIKAELGITSFTPAAAEYKNKRPADNRQLLGYVEAKLALIQHL
jgi:hypothetical protein